MKANLKVQGVIELKDEDLLKALRLVVLKRSGDLLEAVSTIVKEVYGYTPIKIQKDPDLTKVVAIIDQYIDEGAQRLGAEIKPAVDRDSNAGFVRKWTGFYGTAKDIFDEMREKKKHSLSFKDFYATLLTYDDIKSGGKLFVKPDASGSMVPIEITRVKQYLSHSQLKKTPQMKGIKFDDKSQEFRF